jgi:hypothetical protein
MSEEKKRGRAGRQERAKERAAWTTEQRQASVRRRIAAGYNLRSYETREIDPSSVGVGHGN